MKLGLLGAKSICVLIFGLAMATSAQAITVVLDGETHIIGPGLETEFVGLLESAGGMGSWAVDFEATTAGDGSALVTIGDLVSGTFSGLTMSWVNTDTDGVISSTPIVPIVTTLNTLFIDPDSLNQTLLIEWTDSLDKVGFDVEVVVSSVPVPAAVWLFGSGLLGSPCVRIVVASNFH